MRLQISETKNAASFYVVKSIYENGKHSSKVVEKLGTRADLEKKLNGKDPVEWAQEYVNELNKQEKENKREVFVKYSPAKIIAKGKQKLFNGGYLFLQKIYHELGIDKICKIISDKYRFSFDLNCILSMLLYGRIIFPSSKLSTYEQSKTFIEQPGFKLHDIYRALDVVGNEMDFIQSEIYKNSLKVSKRNTGALYYDCTNFFFEIEQEDGLRQFAHSKENRPNPVVGMGMFMDGDGIPLAFSIDKGNTNEQVTLKPLEKKILSDFELSQFIVCTDAGLSSAANRKFNDKEDRAFITTQSVKKLKAHLKQWALDAGGWHLPGEVKVFNITMLDTNKDFNKTYYKERWIKEDGLEQKLIVSFSLKYQDYQRKIRDGQITRAQKVIDSNPTKLKKVNQNDYKRFIAKTSITPDGEVADKELYRIDADLISKEAAYDGFYAVCTNLEDDTSSIIDINRKRWEIEECFRIMKSEFKARPAFLNKDNRIEAHFATCFMALILFRFLEKRVGEGHTYPDIIDTLREMNFYKIEGEGYVPIYTRTNLTDKLHDASGFRSDYEIVTNKQMKTICKQTKH